MGGVIDPPLSQKKPHQLRAAAAVRFHILKPQGESTQMETELEFLNDINALISQVLEENGDPWQALRTLANEVRNRLSDLEGDED